LVSFPRHPEDVFFKFVHPTSHSFYYQLHREIRIPHPRIPLFFFVVERFPEVVDEFGRSLASFLFYIFFPLG